MSLFHGLFSVEKLSLSFPSLPEQICRLAILLKKKKSLLVCTCVSKHCLRHCSHSCVPGSGEARNILICFPFLCAVEISFNTYYPDDFWQTAIWKSFSRINYSPQYLYGRHLVNSPFYTTAHGQPLWKVPKGYYNNVAQNENYVLLWGPCYNQIFFDVFI